MFTNKVNVYYEGCHGKCAKAVSLSSTMSTLG